MSAIGAAVLSSLAGWIDGRLSDEHANRQIICETVAAQLRDMAAALRESGEGAVVEDLADDDGTEPYCTTCRRWVGLFVGLDGWHHFRGDPAPGGLRELYDAGHVPVIGWTIPPGRALAPGDMSTVLAGLAFAAETQRHRTWFACEACEAHPAGLCEDHADGLDAADAYDAVAAQLGRITEPEEDPPIEEYDPGPEIDNEGGMSEYRHAGVPEEPW